ncbi:hypothetical protein MIR68_002379 [Amoeboaphelidium protococcarum]|nr:hypothetical protein MIR68_002379 [Amoeboaphelidium protococcarum]KAI3652264.1 hypothetical protein MP228_003567 [Amoeboaphelidium protococcarum]
MVDISLCIPSAMLMLLDGCLGILCSSLAGGHAISRPLHVKRSAYCPALVGPKSATQLSEWQLFIVWVSLSISCDSLKFGLVWSDA